MEQQHHRTKDDYKLDKNGSFTRDTTTTSLLVNETSPLRHQTDYLSENTSVKICRICLEEEQLVDGSTTSSNCNNNNNNDECDEFIVPCLCTGSRKYVHRSCLNQWRITEPNRAFYQCTECLYHYELINKHDHRQQQQQQPSISLSTSNCYKLPLSYLQFCYFISRDMCVVTIVLQAAICLLGYFVRLLDQNDLDSYLINLFNKNDTDTNDIHYELGIYYLFGIALFLTIIGTVGSTIFCCNGCTIPSFDDNTNYDDGCESRQSSRLPYHENTDQLAYTDTMERGMSLQQLKPRKSNNEMSGNEAPMYQRNDNKNMYQTQHSHCQQQSRRSNEYYRRHRHRYNQRRRRHERCDDDDCDFGGNYYSVYDCCNLCDCYDSCDNTDNSGGTCCSPGRSHARNSTDDGCCCCADHSSSSNDNCCFCCDDHSTSSNHNDDCCCCCCDGHSGNFCRGDGGGDNDTCAVVLFAVLLLFVLMAIIGLLLLLVIGVTVCQRIVQRYIFLLHKRSLVHAFDVVDLSKKSSSLPNSTSTNTGDDKNSKEFV